MAASAKQGTLNQAALYFWHIVLGHYGRAKQIFAIAAFLIAGILGGIIVGRLTEQRNVATAPKVVPGGPALSSTRKWDGNPDHPDCSDTGHPDPNHPRAIISAKYSDACDDPKYVQKPPNEDDKLAAEAGSCCMEARDSRHLTLAEATAFAKSPNYYVRLYLASNKSAPTQALELLRDDSQYHVRFALADNPNAPTDVLTSSTYSDDPNLRSAAAQNPSTPAKRLLEMAENDEDSTVRYSIAANLRAPVAVLVYLTHDPDNAVRKMALSALAERNLQRESRR